MNLISCHGFVKKKNSTLVLVCQYCLVDYYLAKVLVIIEHNSKQLSSVSNNVKLRIHAINKQKKDYVMACYTEISSLENTINKSHILSNLHYFTQQNFYHYKQEVID